MRTATSRLLLVGTLSFLVACKSSDSVELPSSAEVGETPAAFDGAWGALLAAQLEGSAPGPEMQGLRSLVGQWDVSMTLLAWPSDEVELPATVAQGQAQIRSAFGERFLRWETVLNWAGTPVASEACLGFDQQSQRYQFWRASDLSSFQSLSIGAGDAQRGGLYLDRTEANGGEVIRQRTLLRVKGADQFELEEFGYDPNAGEWLAMRITRYTRRTAQAAPGRH